MKENNFNKLIIKIETNKQTKIKEREIEFKLTVRIDKKCYLFILFTLLLLHLLVTHVNNTT